MDSDEDDDGDVDSKRRSKKSSEYCLGWSHCLTRHSAAVTCLDSLVCDDGIMLLSGSSDSTAQLWRLCRNEPMKSEYDCEENDEEDEDEESYNVDALDRHSHRSTLFCSGGITSLKWAPSNVKVSSGSSSSGSSSSSKRSQQGHAFLVGTLCFESISNQQNHIQEENSIDSLGHNF